MGQNFILAAATRTRHRHRRCALLDLAFPVYVWMVVLEAKEDRQRPRHDRKTKDWGIIQQKWGLLGLLVF